MPRLEFGWTCALLSPEGGVCVRWCNVVPFQAAGQGISREDSAAQPGAERLQAAFRPRRNSQPSRMVSSTLDGLSGGGARSGSRSGGCRGRRVLAPHPIHKDAVTVVGTCPNAPNASNRAAGQRKNGFHVVVCVCGNK